MAALRHIHLVVEDFGLASSRSRNEMLVQNIKNITANVLQLLLNLITTMSIHSTSRWPSWPCHRITHSTVLLVYGTHIVFSAFLGRMYYLATKHSNLLKSRLQFETVNKKILKLTIAIPDNRVSSTDNTVRYMYYDQLSQQQLNFSSPASIWGANSDKSTRHA